MRKIIIYFQKSVILRHLSQRYPESDNRFEFSISKLGLLMIIKLSDVAIIFEQQNRTTLKMSISDELN